MLRHWAKVPTLGLGVSTVTEGPSRHGRRDAARARLHATREFPSAREGWTAQRE